MNNTQIADIIDLAVEKLEACPWGQANGRVGQQICAEDAIWMAIRGIDTLSQYWEPWPVDSATVGLKLSEQASVVSGAIADHVGVDRGVLWYWNDQLGRTKQEVIDAFQETAKELRNEASPT